MCLKLLRLAGSSQLRATPPLRRSLGWRRFDATAMGKKKSAAKPKAKAAEPPGEWMRQSAHRLEAQNRFLGLDAERRYFSRPDLERWQWHHRSWTWWSGSSNWWEGDSRVSLPPPWVASEPRWAWSEAQHQAWQQDFTPPTGGLLPGGQPTTREEEIHRMVTGRVTMLNFCPSSRAVMICGRPVVVPTEHQYDVRDACDEAQPV